MIGNPTGHNRRSQTAKALAVAGVLIGTTAGLSGPPVARAQEAGTYAGDLDGVGIFPNSLRPSERNVDDTHRTTLGVKFASASAGSISGVQFFRGGKNTGVHRVQVWSTDGTLLGRGRYTGDDNGWVTAALNHPVAVEAGQRYIAAYVAPRGHYSRTIGALRPGHPVTANGLTAYRGMISRESGEPDRATSANYLVDVVFSEDAATTPPPSTPTPTPTPTPSPEPPGSGDGDLALSRIPWEGGSAYWSQFPKAHQSGWDDPGFFPISVFYGKPEDAAQLKALGVNTYMGAEHDGTNLKAITDKGVFVIAQQEEFTPTEVGNNPGVVGWFISDECEMGYSGCPEDESGSIAKERQYVAKVRGYADGRFRQANFGNGVLRTWWAPSTMDDHVQLMDVASADKYTYTSPHLWSIVPNSPDWPTGATVARAASYGWQVDQMKRFEDPSTLRPIWTFVETAQPLLDEAGARTITPDQLEGAIWSAIIHEARGVAFFQHNNNGKCGVYSLLDCGTALQTKVTSVTSTIRTLAPVINSQSYAYDFNNGTDTMLKTYGGDAYVFADIGLRDGTGSKTFDLPDGVNGGVVTVVGEGRTIPIVNGSFTDSFAAEYTHHIYRIALRSSS